MPIVTITLQAGRPTAETRAIMDAVHRATVSAFEIPDASRNQRLIEVAPEHFFYPEGRSSAFMSVEIAAFPGRSDESKAQLYREITENLQTAAGIEARDVMILIHEAGRENWGINGRPASRPRQQ